jgi:hypothetical protein
MKSPKNDTRRFFLKSTFGTLVALPFVGLFTQLGWSADAGLVSEADPVASALGYKHSVKDIDFKRFPKRKDPKSKTQFCDNCRYYLEPQGATGKCQMITGGRVAAKGWCGSWSKKA